MGDHRRSRGATLAVAALAVPGLVLAGAAGASAADSFTNDTLPGKVFLDGGQSATVTLTTPEGFNCQDWFVRKVGQRNGQVNVTPMAASEGCSAETLVFTVSVPEDYTMKANVVVKFKVYNDDGTAKIVETLVVKVNKDGAPQTGAPTSKPSKPAKPDGGGPRWSVRSAMPVG